MKGINPDDGVRAAVVLTIVALLIIDHPRPGVGALELQAFAYPLVQQDFQRVIDRISARNGYTSGLTMRGSCGESRQGSRRLPVHQFDLPY